MNAIGRRYDWGYDQIAAMIDRSVGVDVEIPEDGHGTYCDMHNHWPFSDEKRTYQGQFPPSFRVFQSTLNVAAMHLSCTSQYCTFGLYWMHMLLSRTRP
jgi:hypothetical protein